MTIEEALELIDCIERIFLLKARPKTETTAIILRSLFKLRDAPGPSDIIRGKVLALEGWVQFLFRKPENYSAIRSIQSVILAECQSLKDIICQQANMLKC